MEISWGIFCKMGIIFWVFVQYATMSMPLYRMDGQSQSFYPNEFGHKNMAGLGPRSTPLGSNVPYRRENGQDTLNQIILHI